MIDESIRVVWQFNNERTGYTPAGKYIYQVFKNGMWQYKEFPFKVQWKYNDTRNTKDILKLIE